MNDYWPFTRQRDFDAFMSGIKSHNHILIEAAIRAWIVARGKV